MQLARNHFFADAALAAQQHADVAVGDALDHRHDVTHRGARSPERRALRVLADLRPQPRHLAAEHGLFDGLANGRFERSFAETIRVVGLDDVVERALTHRVDDGGGRLRPESMMTCTCGWATRIAFSVSRPSIPGIDTSSRTTSGGVSLCIVLQQIGAAGERLHFVAAGFQQRFEIFDELLIVIDQRKPGSGHERGSSNGNRMPAVCLDPFKRPSLARHARRVRPPHEPDASPSPPRSRSERSRAATPGPEASAANVLRWPSEQFDTPFNHCDRQRTCLATQFSRRCADHSRPGREPGDGSECEPAPLRQRPTRPTLTGQSVLRGGDLLRISASVLLLADRCGPARTAMPAPCFVTELGEATQGFLDLFQRSPPIGPPACDLRVAGARSRGRCRPGFSSSCASTCRMSLISTGMPRRAYHRGQSPVARALKLEWPGAPRTVANTRILLVDDYPDALEIWGLYLRSLGYDVVTAEDGLEAVEEAHRMLPDIIILDLDLPGITGFEAASRLRSRIGYRPYPADRRDLLLAPDTTRSRTAVRVRFDSGQALRADGACG